MVRTIGVAFTVFLSLVTLTFDKGRAVEITQYFPAAATGEPAPRPQSGWKIKYEILKAGTHAYGGSAVWEFQSIAFMRGHTPSGEEDWINVLDRLAMAEMYVPYYDGLEIWDITGFSFNFVKASNDYIPRQGIISGKLLDDVVIAELVDDNVRWMDNAGGNKIRRGQVLELWATLSAGNYRYVLKYGFADDGTIYVRAGGTAANLRSVPLGDHAAMHIHSPGWRLEFNLGDPRANEIEIVEREHDPNSAAADLIHRPFANGAEGGELWDAERFTSLMVTSPAMNRHDPASRISYKLVSMRSGSTRTFRPHTQYDFWVSRIPPEHADRELRFREVNEYVRNPEPLEGHPLALWTATALHHIPRTEDFGAAGFNASEGVAIMMWTGFDLMPHNLWDKTPLFERD